MNKYVYLVSEGDAWLSRDSRVIMGVFDDFGKAVNAIVNEMLENEVFTSEDVADDADYVRHTLEEYRQTQGYDTNYLIETITLNEWGEI